MLHPRETDLPGLFLVFVVLPLIAYILLGKWSEVSNKKERIRVLAQVAAEESFRAEAMAAANVIPLVVNVSKSNNGFHECARCFSPATTRCSRCKTVRYCSGKCQIIHWRQVHKHECQILEYNSSCASPKSTSNEESMSGHEQSLSNENFDTQWSESNIEQNGHEKVALDDPLDSSFCTSEPVFDKRSSDKRSRKFNREIPALDPSANTCSTSYNNSPPKETFIRHKPKRSHVMLSKEVNNADILGCVDSKSATHEGLKSNSQHDPIISAQNGTKPTSRSPGTKTHKSAKSTVEMSRDQKCLGTENTGQIADELDVSRIRDSKENGVVNKGFMKMIGLKRLSKHGRVETSEVNGNKHKKIKMLFPYEEFVKFFQYEVFDFLPRGLVNCGNSCYANAVLQCLTSTKPLTIYMLHRSHSRSCRAKSWCLMCELEHHVMMLRERGEPLSLSRILVHMRSVNCQIGDGSQEDAHEFLRLLITSMQSICLEGLGGEDAVEPKLQETTFIQHTFGGQLRSKVKCSRCHHESVRYENIMDLTLEIFGWVESLEDALTQFTSPEDLDGENMYRCGRCATYVRARKQLAIQEAPNILTIVLKRFQEGSYGKINKCIRYPEMLDMIPYMTGTDDIPPLYMLYGVVVHLDTMNASFSGHYISYVKDHRGNWFRIDDAQVHQVPSSQVMSEGAYILFYTRSSPRPPKNHTGKLSKNSTPNHKQEPARFQEGQNRTRPIHANPNPNPSSFDYSDATSSDWSIFTSSDDASFTTESTRDSFSTVDYNDHSNDPVSSIFNGPIDYLSRNTVSCSRFSRSRVHTRFMEEQGEKRRVVKLYGPVSGELPYRLNISSSNCGSYMDNISRTYGLNC